MRHQLDLDKICREVETKWCRIHLEKAKAIVVDNKIQVTACCTGFLEECEKFIDEETRKQIDEAIGL